MYIFIYSRWQLYIYISKLCTYLYAWSPCRMKSMQMSACVGRLPAAQLQTLTDDLCACCCLLYASVVLPPDICTEHRALADTFTSTPSHLPLTTPHTSHAPHSHHPLYSPCFPSSPPSLPFFFAPL